MEELSPKRLSQAEQNSESVADLPDLAVVLTKPG